MTDSFSFSRFTRLLATDLQANARKYAMWIGLFVAIIAALVVISIISCSHKITNPNWGSHYDTALERDPVATFMTGIFYLTLYITVAIAASLSMSNLAVKTSRINTLMLPATQMEKFLSRWVIFVPGFLVLFLVCFQAIDWLRVGAEWTYFGINAHICPINVLHLLAPGTEPFYAIILSLIVTQSIYVLGSTIWPLNSMVKTTCACFVIGLVFIIFTMICFSALFKPDCNYGWHLSDEVENVIVVSVGLVMTVINYVIAYLRYKEIEIIQRW